MQHPLMRKAHPRLIAGWQVANERFKELFDPREVMIFVNEVQDSSTH